MGRQGVAWVRHSAGSKTWIREYEWRDYPYSELSRIATTTYCQWGSSNRGWRCEFSKIERTTSREPLAISENPLGLVAIIRNTGKLLAEVEYNLVHVNPQDFCRRVAIIFGFNDEGVAAIEDHFDEEPSSFGSNKGLRVLGSGIGSVFGRLHIATHQVSLASEYLGLEQKKKRLDESADGDHASESHGQSVNARAGIFLGLNLGGLAIGLFGSLVVPYRRQRLQFCLFGIGGICMALGMIYWLRPMT